MKQAVLTWFIDKHALAEAHKSQDTALVKTLEQFKKDLEQHIIALEELL